MAVSLRSRLTEELVMIEDDSLPIEATSISDNDKPRSMWIDISVGFNPQGDYSLFFKAILDDVIATLRKFHVKLNEVTLTGAVTTEDFGATTLYYNGNHVNTINIYITLIKDSDNKRRVFKVARNIIKFLKNHSSLKYIICVYR
jgi:hypothetical protein